MSRRVLVLSIVLAAAAPAPAMAAKSTVTVAGTLKGAKPGTRVMALPTQGSAVTTTAKRGAFSVKVPKTALNGLSLQLLAADGGYLGPVLLYAKGSKGSVRFGKAAPASIRLGQIKILRGYAKPARALPKKSVLLTGNGAVTLRNGAPAGAGTLGLTAAAAAKASQSSGDQGGGNGNGGGGNGGNGGGGGQGAPGASCSSQQSADTGAGGDCDRDGIPNVVDVDDNGNRSLDGVDPESAQTTAKANPYFSIRPHFRNQINAYAGATNDSINAYLGSSSEETGLTMALYLSQRAIDPLSSTPFANVWVTCGSGQPWCAPGTATAKVSGFGDLPALDGGSDRFAQSPWLDFHGSRCDQSACTPLGGSDPNGLAEIRRGGDPTPTYVASVRPSAANTFAEVVPGDLLTLNARTASGTITSVPMAIPPYFVTSPALSSYALPGQAPTTVSYPVTNETPGSNAGTPIQLDESGRLTVRLWRPQRFALPGETASFYDIGGLQWGVSVESYFQNGQFRSTGKQTACPVSDLVGLEPAGGNPNPAITMVDATSTDAPTDTARAAESTIGFTVDIKSCLQQAGAPTDSGVGTLVGLIAQGALQPGGANTTGMDFEVRLP